MDDPKVDRRTFLKVAGAGVTASAIALAVPGVALGAPGAAAGAERFLLGTARGHVDPSVLRYVSRAIAS
ncbi:MAG TPA: hypothetical protein VGA30_06995 [Actinomycetota bacterium]